MTARSEAGERSRSPRSPKPAAIVYSILALSALTWANVQDVKAGPEQQVHVLELFTSQGCSSCPPADALLRKLAKRENVIAISFPVSYWDHLGWKDTLAKAEFNERQYAYAKMRGDREIYTPQLIVDGLTHVVGSSRDAVESAMNYAGERLENVRVPLSLEVEPGNAKISAGSATAGEGARSGKLWLVCFERSVEVAIGDGENSGRRISYTNVARELIPAGEWNGEIAQYTVIIPRGGSFDGVAVLLQDRESAAVIGAAVASVPAE